MTVFSGHQPNFLPYMGFFYKMFKSDFFVLDDDVQYSSSGFHNTNFIKVKKEKFQMTVPVSYSTGDLINEVRICYNKPWDRKLLKTIEMSYKKAPYFEEGFSLVEKHLALKKELLFDLNLGLIKEIHDKFKIDSKLILASREFPTDLKNNERNVYQGTKLNATVYYSGIGGKEYNDEKLYNYSLIKLEYSDYVPVVYGQGKGNFIENLSVLDYIFYNGYNLPTKWRK